MKYKILFAVAVFATILMPGCKDEFADLNTDPSVVSKPDIRFLFTKALSDFDPYNYGTWFYNVSQYIFPWVQASSSTDVNLNVMKEYDGNRMYSVMQSTEEIKNIVDVQYAPEDGAKYQHIKAMCDPLVIYLGLFATDMGGSMPYTEAYKGRFTNPPLLTPKYDTQEELFNTWLKELDNSINLLSNPVTMNGQEVQQVSLGSQDIIYKGDAKKWAKFANSLKLKIAVRLLHVDKARALKIAEEVTSSPAGILSSVDDDFVYNLGSQQYHFGDDIWMGRASKQLIDFLVSNRDPRVRFFFEKNSFNSRVVQAFFDARYEQDNNPDFSETVRKTQLPSYIKELVESEVDSNGREIFKGWKAPGEPWVRYFGAPTKINANLDPQYYDYFDSNRFKITLNGVEKSYSPVSYYNEENVRGQIDYTYPDAPGAPVVQDKEDCPWYAVFFSTAEVNLYLAELRLLGANLPNTAEHYFREAIVNSVAVTDKVAGLNRIPYYHEIYDTEFEKSIKLQDGEIEALLEQEAYQLTGDAATKLEKVYIQQYIHFLSSPNDLIVTVRRSGIPKKDSKYIAWATLIDESYPIPRRWAINDIETSDLMYDIKIDAFKAQGFTIGTREPGVLNTERVWYDKNAPDFGSGPNF